MCGPNFCSMLTSQDIRDYATANQLSIDTARSEGMAQKSSEFRRSGAEIYLHAEGPDQ
jgi:phosphomethylpyrimidine synthase